LIQCDSPWQQFVIAQLLVGVLVFLSILAWVEYAAQSANKGAEGAQYALIVTTLAIASIVILGFLQRKHALEMAVRRKQLGPEEPLELLNRGSEMRAVATSLETETFL
jgi:hypothetical protein